jgi:DNA polymerase Ligase (LigD)
MPRFAILRHDYPTVHWDLFLESGPVLRSWRLLDPLGPDATVLAEPAGDHRLIYLDYEGPVSGGRGTVTRVDAGTFAWELDTDDRIAVQLSGIAFRGRLELQAESAGWTCRFQPDRP